MGSHRQSTSSLRRGVTAGASPGVGPKIGPGRRWIGSPIIRMGPPIIKKGSETGASSGLRPIPGSLTNKWRKAVDTSSTGAAGASPGVRSNISSVINKRREVAGGSPIIKMGSPIIKKGSEAGRIGSPTIKSARPNILVGSHSGCLIGPHISKNKSSKCWKKGSPIIKKGVFR